MSSSVTIAHASGKVDTSPAIDTAIVGGGVIGLSLAWELARRGRAVTVIERHGLMGPDPVASGASDLAPSTSWAAAGILPPAHFELATDSLDRLRGFSHRIWPDWAARLQETTGIDVGLIACGGYYLAETAGEAAAMIGMTAYWDELDIECRALSSEELRARLPDLASWMDKNPWLRDHPNSAAWWVPDEYQVRPPRLLKALHAACIATGVTFQIGAPVTHITDSPTGSVIHHEIPQGSESRLVAARRVVLCGGAATGLIDATVGLQNALIPVRGQVLLLRTDSFRQPLVINMGNRYLVSRGDGYVLVGSCEEEVGFAQHTTAPMIDQLRSFATHVCPSLAKAVEVYRWAGLRPMTFDGFPLLGHVPGRCNLFIASGHYRSGIHFSPATAVAMADLIEQRPSFMDLSPFAVSLSPAAPRRSRNFA